MGGKWVAKMRHDTAWQCKFLALKTRKNLTEPCAKRCGAGTDVFFWRTPDLNPCSSPDKMMLFRRKCRKPEVECRRKWHWSVHPWSSFKWPKFRHDMFQGGGFYAWYISTLVHGWFTTSIFNRTFQWFEGQRPKYASAATLKSHAVNINHFQLAPAAHIKAAGVSYWQLCQRQWWTTTPVLLGRHV